MTDAYAPIENLTPAQHLAFKLLGEDAKRAWQRMTSSRGVCIPATRIACSVLNAAGLTATPVAVDVTYHNASYAEYLANGGAEPETHEELVRLYEEHGYFAGGIVYNARERGVAAELLSDDPNGWHGGHLVTTFLHEGERYIFDSTIDQCDKPEEGIVFPPTIVLSVPMDWAEGDLLVMHELENGCQLGYKAWPHEQGYLTTPIWTALDDPFDPMRGVQGSIIRRLKVAA